ncbi:hypothetical protein [Streptomyces griseosporeus]
MSAPPSQSNNSDPTPDTGQGEGQNPQPSPRSRWRRARDWFGGLSEASKIALIGALITTVGGGITGIIVAVIPLVAGSDDKDDKPTTAASSGVPSTTPQPSPRVPSAAAPPPADSSPTDTPTAPPTYKLVYSNQPIALGLGRWPDVFAIDFDTPATRHYTEDEWERLKKDAEETGSPMAPDLSYSNDVWGYMTLRDGRNAAQLPADEAPATGAECARRAQVGGFSEARMVGGDEEPPPVRTVFCIATDKGNIVRAQITRYAGTEPGNPPSQIEFTATMWSPEIH